MSRAVLPPLLLLAAFSTFSLSSAAASDGSHQAELEHKWGEHWAFSGIATFGHTEHVQCLTEPTEPIDIAVIGAPFDTAVSYRPGARMGPRAIRTASARHIPSRGFNPHANLNPYRSWARVVDCGDIPITPFDNAVALRQMTDAFTELGSRRTTCTTEQCRYRRPKLITLGGDHLVALPALRALRKAYGQPLTLLHFDSHLDTLHPHNYPSAWPSEQAQFNHGSVFWKATNEGLISNITSVHAGINTRLSGESWSDFISDEHQGFMRIPADAVDTVGVEGLVKAILSKIGPELPVYLSIDIDVLDPAFAPGTGAPEPGGWTSRELIKILRGISHINIVGADVVEVAPAYDTNGGDTAFVAANLAYEVISGMVKRDADVPVENEVGDLSAIVDPNETRQMWPIPSPRLFYGAVKAAWKTLG